MEGKGCDDRLVFFLYHLLRKNGTDFVEGLVSHIQVSLPTATRCVLLANEHIVVQAEELALELRKFDKQSISAPKAQPVQQEEDKKPDRITELAQVIEWGGLRGTCLYCGNTSGYGHHSACKLYALIQEGLKQ